MEFASALKGALESDGRTALDLARSLGVSHTSVGRWLQGVLPDDASVIASIALTFREHWPSVLVRAYLLDRCPPNWHHLLDGPGTMHDAGHASIATPLERALEAIRAAAVTNPDLRAIVLDLGRLAQGL